jgi:DHA1 family bicyclomycin/chloramphenicol resistance-like MFS transporter
VILLGAGLHAILPSLFIVVSSVGVVATTGTSMALQNYGQSAGSASALLGLLSYIIGGLAAPLVGLGGSGTAVPMGIVIASFDVGSLLCYALLVKRRSA